MNSDVEISANGVVKDGTFQNHGETSDSSDDGEFDVSNSSLKN
mgnify:FL=1